MAHDAKALEELAKALALLSPEEQARVLALAREMEFRPLPPDFDPPTLHGGTKWIGGSLRREDLYDDDRR